MEDILQSVGSRIKIIRGSRGMSQEQLGDKCGFHTSYIGGVERGERNITLENLAKIAEALHVEMKVLFDFQMDDMTDEKEQALLEMTTLLRSLDIRKIKMTKNLLLEVLSAYSNR